MAQNPIEPATLLAQLETGEALNDGEWATLMQLSPRLTLKLRQAMVRKQTEEAAKLLRRLKLRALRSSA